MNNLENKFLKNSKNESILNDWDREHLKKGAFGMVEKMYKNFGNNFPDIIVLAETAGRPLVYLLKPIFENIHTKDGSKIPTFLFFNVGKKPFLNQYVYEDVYGKELKTTEELELFLREGDDDPDLEMNRRIAKKSQVENVAESRKFAQERALEISEIVKNKNLKIALVDDFNSQKNTITEIHNAFKRFGVEIPSYAIMGFPSESMSRAPDIYVNTGFELFEDKNKERGNHPNPRTVSEGYGGHYAFSYTKTHAVGVDKNPNGKYVSVIREKDLEDAKELAINKEKLRNEMTSLGKEVSNELTVNLYKVKT